MNRTLKTLPTILFFGLICGIIYMADAHHQNWLMSLPKHLPYGDKLGHFMLFGMMGGFLDFTLNYRKITIWRQRLLLGSLLVFCFAVLEECSQMAFASRTFDLKDIAFDVMGLCAFAQLRRVWCFCKSDCTK